MLPGQGWPNPEPGQSWVFVLAIGWYSPPVIYGRETHEVPKL